MKKKSTIINSSLILACICLCCRMLSSTLLIWRGTIKALVSALEGVESTTWTCMC